MEGYIKCVRYGESKVLLEKFRARKTSCYNMKPTTVSMDSEIPMGHAIRAKESQTHHEGFICGSKLCVQQLWKEHDLRRRWFLLQSPGWFAEA